MVRSVRDQWNRALDILGNKPSGLITDIDGTISELVAHPDEAVVTEEIKQSLNSLAKKLSVVAVVTGRSAPKAISMLGTSELLVVGNHGMEWAENGRIEVAPEVKPYTDKLNEALDKLSSEVRIPGVLIENKGVTAAIHYRQTENPDDSKRVIFAKLSDLAEQYGLILTEGKMNFELRPPVNLNKGTASIRIAERYNLKSCVFMGDDVTDVDAVRSLRGLAASGKIVFMSIAVLSGQTPPVVLEEADMLLDGVRQVAEFLRWLDSSLK